MRSFDGYTGSPPALVDCSFCMQGEPEERPAQVGDQRRRLGSERTHGRIRRSSRARALESMLLTMSMRMCSLDRSVHGAQSRNTAPNSTHCSSSHEFEEVLKTLRTMAFTALTSTAIKIAQAMISPTRVLNRSIARLRLSQFFKQSSVAGAAGQLIDAGSVARQPHYIQGSVSTEGQPQQCPWTKGRMARRCAKKSLHQP